LTKTEWAQLVGQRSDVHWDRLIFYAKQAVYKACYPLLRGRLEFTDVRVDVRATGGAFRAQLLTPGPPLHGRES
jgi:4'-phosphopantetheinyl transferase EntD